MDERVGSRDQGEIAESPGRCSPTRTPSPGIRFLFSSDLKSGPLEPGWIRVLDSAMTDGLFTADFLFDRPAGALSSVTVIAGQNQRSALNYYRSQPVKPGFLDLSFRDTKPGRL